jgi:hypothetical protein
VNKGKPTSTFGAFEIRLLGDGVFYIFRHHAMLWGADSTRRGRRALIGKTFSVGERGGRARTLLEAMNTWKAALGVLLFFVLLDGFLFYIGPGGILALFNNISRLFWEIITFLIVLGLLYWFVYPPIRDQIRQRQHSGDVAPPPAEKPEETTQETTEETTVAAAPPPQPTLSSKPPPTSQPATPSPGPASGWANPNPDGSCLFEYPIKGNINSKGEYIYHRPTGQFYSRTNAKVCFATESDAQNAGFRPPRR